jgi:hypothetical protein
MSRRKYKENIMIAEHIFELRHVATGTFLDRRGLVADYIKESGIFNHWKIDNNIVHFRDGANKIEQDGGFAGYKSLGYIVYNPPTYNYFVDKTIKFLSIIHKNDEYEIPKPTRFGTRLKIFIPSDMSFDRINNKIYDKVFNNNFQQLVNGKEQDMKFTIQLIESEFNIKIDGGPVQKNEINNFMSFSSDHFKNTGLFLDVDCYKTKNLTHERIPNLLNKGVKLIWNKVDKIATGMGL